MRNFGTFWLINLFKYIILQRNLFKEINESIITITITKDLPVCHVYVGLYNQWATTVIPLVKKELKVHYFCVCLLYFAAKRQLKVVGQTYHRLAQIWV